MAAGISGKSTTGALAVPDQHNPPPGYAAPIVCEGILDMRDVMVPMRDGKHLCVDIYRPNIDGKFPALLAIAPHNKEYQTPEFAEAVQWAQPAWSRMWFGGAEAIPIFWCAAAMCMSAAIFAAPASPMVAARANGTCTI